MLIFEVRHWKAAGGGGLFHAKRDAGGSGGDGAGAERRLSTAAWAALPLAAVLESRPGGPRVRTGPLALSLLQKPVDPLAKKGKILNPRTKDLHLILGFAS